MLLNSDQAEATKNFLTSCLSVRSEIFGEKKNFAVLVFLSIFNIFNPNFHYLGHVFPLKEFVYDIQTIGRPILSRK